MEKQADSGGSFFSRAGQWLFNPFERIAGGQALGIGLGIMVGSALVAAAGGVRFDGVLDCHLGAPGPLWVFLADGLIAWGSLAVILYPLGRLLAPGKVRAIDVFGTLALARAPYALVLVPALLPGTRRYSEALIQQVQELASDIASRSGGVLVLGRLLLPPGTTVADLLSFALMIVTSLVVLVWMVVLLYRAYAVSCNLSGARGILSFIGGLLAAEVLSKVLILLVMVGQTLLGGVSTNDDFDAADEGQRLVEFLASGDYAGAVGCFDEGMKQALPPGKLEQAWLGLLDRHGPFRRSTGVRLDQGWIFTSAFVTCECERSKVCVKVVFSPSGKVSGLWYSPAR